MQNRQQQQLQKQKGRLVRDQQAPSRRGHSTRLSQSTLHSRSEHSDLDQANAVSNHEEADNEKQYCEKYFRKHDQDEGQLENYQISNNMQVDSQLSHHSSSNSMIRLNSKKIIKNRRKGASVRSDSSAIRSAGGASTSNNNTESHQSGCVSVPMVRIITIAFIISCNLLNSYGISLNSGNYYWMFLSLIAIMPLGLIGLVVKSVNKYVQRDNHEQTKVSLNSQLWQSNPSSYLLLVPYYNHQLQTSQFCEPCSQYQLSNRVLHCRRCDVCHIGFDHYCVWLNCCIVTDNYAYFLRFVMVLSANVLCTLLNSLICLGRVQPIKHSSWRFPTMIFIACGLLSFAALTFCCYVLVYHLFLQSNGVSTKQYLALGMLMPGLNTIRKSMCWKPQVLSSVSVQVEQSQGVFPYFSLPRIRQNCEESQIAPIKYASLKLISKSSIKSSSEFDECTQFEEESMTESKDQPHSPQFQSNNEKSATEQISDMTNSVINLSSVSAIKVRTTESQICHLPVTDSD